MRCVQALSAAALRRLFQRVCQPAGDLPASVPHAELFAASGHHFTRALRQANARAWFALEVLLAGESLWERAQLEWERSLDEEFYLPLRDFLDCASVERLAPTVNEARDAVRTTIRMAAREGLFATGMLDIPALARQIEDDCAADLDDSGTLRRLADHWETAGYAALRPIATLDHDDGTPLAVLLVAGFFRQAVALDPDLFGDLADLILEADGDEALEDAHRWAVLFQDHRLRIEALLNEVACPETTVRPASVVEGNAAEHLQRGQAHAQRGQHDAAIGEFSAAIQIDPFSAAALVSRGEAYRLKGDYARALDDFNAAIRLEPGNAQTLFARGQVHWLSRQHDQAINDFTGYLDSQPESAVGYYFRGKARTDKGELEAALTDFCEAARLDPSQPWVHHDRGDVHAFLGDFGRATLDYTQAIRLNPHAAISYLRRAETYAAQGEFTQAIADYTQTLRLDPLNSAAYLGRGTAYRQTSQWQEATADFSRALEIDEANPQLFYQRGLLYQQAGDHRRAVEDLDAAIGLNPHDAEAYYQRGRAHATFGAHEKALADLNQALRINPQHALAWHSRGELHAARGASNEAIQDYSEALRLDADLAEAYAGRARVKSRIGLLDDALADCDAALLRDEHSVEAYLVRGSALAQKGECHRAVGDFTQAIQFDAVNVQAYYLRGLAHHREGKLAEALADLSAVLRLDQRNARAFVQRAAVLQSAQQHERALRDLAHAVRLDHRHAAAYCRQLGVVHSQRQEFERAVADYSLVLLFEPKDDAAIILRNEAWKGFVAQRRSQPATRPRRRSAAQTAPTSMRLRATETMVMPAAAVDQEQRKTAEETTEFELTFDGSEIVDESQEQAAAGSDNSTAEHHAAVTMHSAPARQGKVETKTRAESGSSAVEMQHEEMAVRREQELKWQLEEERKQKMAEFQQKLAESKKQAEELRQKAEANRKKWAKKKSNDDDADDDDRMPLWKKGMLAAAACIAVWFLGSVGYSIYADYRAQAPFSLASFCRDFEVNATEARKKYDGGAFELTGKAKLVQAGNEIRLAIETPEVPQWSVHCRFDMSPKNFKAMVADKIQPGQDVTVEGRCSYQPKEGKGVILMEECVLRKSG